MYGMSYMGGVQWLAAQRRPPALRALAPATAPFDFQADHFRRGGALAVGLLLTFVLGVIAPNRLLRRGGRGFVELVDDIDRLTELARRPVAAVERHDPELAAWMERVIAGDGVPGRPASPAVPALQIAGWHDVLLQPDLDRFVEMRTAAESQEARERSRLVVGPWAHAAFLNGVGQLDFGVRASGAALDLRGDMTDLHRRWFDARLRGDGNGDGEPPVKAFVMGANRWRDLDAWPPETTTLRLHLHRGGGLAQRAPEPSEPSAFTLDDDDPVPTLGGAILLPAGYVRGPVEQSLRERRPDVLTFTSGPLEAPLLVLGRVRLEAWVAAPGDVVARLCDLDPGGRSFNVVDGILRVREPGRVHVDLWSTAQRFERGHRLRLQVCASDFPRYDLGAGGRNLIYHTPDRPSALLLPLARE
jgi:putative CocE/NonD family hydrolase